MSDLKRLELYHDFNALIGVPGGPGVAPLVCRGTIEDLQRLDLELSEGLLVTLYQPDDVDEYGNPDRLEVDATVTFDATHGCWTAVFDLDELDYASKKRR